jgi:hypothetical protein
MRNTVSKSPVELDPALIGHVALNSFLRGDSPGRVQMWSSHLTQMPVIESPSPQMIQSGMAREYGKAAYAVRMPEDGTIIATIARYRRGADILSIPENEAQTIVLYMDAKTGIVDFFELKGHHFEHSHFGFKYRKTEEYGQIAKNQSFKKDTPFLVSPNVQPNGDYHFGYDAYVAHLSHPAVSEDGIVICRDKLETYAVRTYEKRDISFGVRMIPLNNYGDDTPGNYRCIPEIGSIIDPSGRVMTLRRDITDDKNIKMRNQFFDDVAMGLITKTVKGTSTVCNYFDQSTYAKPGGRVVDIRVFHDESVAPSFPPEYEAQLKRYYDATCEFYRRLLKEEKELRDRYKENLRFSKELSGLLAEAYGYLGTNSETKERVQKLYRNDPMDRWRVEITLEYRTVPTLGSKFTGIHGDKGVICYIAEPDEMPIDSKGRRADFIVDAGSSLSRMNLGRDYEPYFNAAAEDDLERIIQMLGINPKENPMSLKLTLEEMEANQDPRFIGAWNHAMEFIQIVSPMNMHPILNSPNYKGTKAGYLLSIILAGFQLWFPTNAQTDYVEAVCALEEMPHHQPFYDYVHYRGYSGRLTKTKNKFRIAKQTMVMLEKIGDDWMAVASGQRQHFGILAPITNLTKYNRPTRVNSVKNMGETEVRILASYIGPDATADLQDRSNNPDTAKLVVEGIIKADQPTNIPLLVDRNIYPYGGSKPLMLVKHMLSCSGSRFVYQPYRDPRAEEHMANYRPTPLY